MKLAWRRKTGVEAEMDSSELAKKLLRGATMLSSSMLKGKCARLKASIVGIEASCRRSFTTRRGIFSNGLIVKTPELLRLNLY